MDIDFTGMKSADIYLENLTVKEFAYLKQMACFGEALGVAFSSGMKLVDDDGRIIEDEIELLNFNDDSDYGGL